MGGAAMIEDIAWAALRANGDPRHIPLLLRALRTTDAQKRDDAWRQLVELIHHQGDVYEATVVTLPLLLAMARDDTIPRAEVLELVSSFADVECPGELGERLRRVFVDAHPMLLSALASPDPDERRLAAYVLGHLPEARESSLVALSKALATERDARPLALAVWASGALEGPDADPVPYLRIAREAQSPLVRAVASAWLARWRGRDAEEIDLRTVVDAMARGLEEGSTLPFGFLEESLNSPLGNRLLQQLRTGRYVVSD